MKTYKQACMEYMAAKNLTVEEMQVILGQRKNHQKVKAIRAYFRTVRKYVPPIEQWDTFSEKLELKLELAYFRSLDTSLSEEQRREARREFDIYNEIERKLKELDDLVTVERVACYEALDEIDAIVCAGNKKPNGTRTNGGGRGHEKDLKR